MAKSKCQVGSCSRDARYKINNENEFIPVCGTHDKQIGRTALINLGWDTKDAIRWEFKPDDY